MSGYFDYSQYGEQKYILKALGIKPDTFTEHAHPVGCPCGHCDGKGSVVQTAFVSIKPMGRLLEIGAFDAFAMSNSRALIELGWSAVLFEPSPGPLRALVKEYGNNPKVEVVAAAVIVGGTNVLALRGMGADKSNALVKLRITDDAVTADASNEAHLKKWEGYGFYGTMTVLGVSLARVFEVWGPFDFVSIDTEGTSADLFKRMIELGERPRCVVVEHDNRWDEMRKAAELGGYRLMHDPKENGTNVVLELKP